MGTGDREHVVIVGGGFGGLWAAKALRGAPVRVTLVDRENHHLFQPLLYQVATSGLSPAQIATPIRVVLRRQKNASVLYAEVVGVDLDARELTLDRGDTIRYDYLIVAAGAKTNYFGHDGWAEHAHGLKDLRDAIRIRERVLLAFESAERETDREARRRLLTFVVIGGGPTGVEMAGAISELGRQVMADDFGTISAGDIRVMLVEMGDRVLASFRPELSQRAAEQLRDLDVELALGRRVTDVSEEGVELDGTERVPAALVVWASGVAPVSLAERMGTPRTRRGQLVVGDDLSIPGRPEVFAVGDIAAFVPEGDEHPLPGVAPVAMQGGRHAARTIAREIKGLPRTPFRYVDKGIMATIGRSRAVMESGALRASGLLAWIGWLVVHIFFLIGARNRLVVMFEWAWAYFSFKRGARIIVARRFPIRGQQLEGELRPGPDPLHVGGPGRASRVE